MVNAWSLLYDEYYGTMNKTYPVKKMSDENRVTPQESDEYDPIVTTVGSGNTASMGDFVNFDLTDSINNISIDTSNFDTLDLSSVELPDGMTVNYDMDPALSYMEPGTVLSTEGVDTLNLKIPNDDGIPLPQNFLADNDDAAAHHFTTPGIQKDCTRKYKEDESIKALQDYISTTYGGHYTSDNNNVQTLDLIESVGDAEAFCRSNAIKYLSRYDKKGQAKRDILKALHYSLLLYHFSGQLNETPTRGYETF
jgi:hypothetical protein